MKTLLITFLCMYAICSHAQGPNVMDDAWFLQPAAASAGSAIGGTKYATNGYWVHVFTNTGTTNFTVSGSLSCEVLVVAGGGAGGGSVADGSTNFSGAGGGAGGYTNIAVYSASGTIGVTVGAGGVKVANSSASKNGSNSMFGTITAYGGGRGGVGSSSSGNGYSGGSGGGSVKGGTSGIGSQGYQGGTGSVLYGSSGSGGGVVRCRA